MTEHTPSVTTYRRFRSRWRKLLRRSTAILALLGLVFAAWQQADPQNATVLKIQSLIRRPTAALIKSQPGLVPVVHVDDGDTIIVRLASGQEETVRLLGIDTPEVKDPRKPVQCFGQAASDHTHARLDYQSVRLEPDPQDTDRDKYGRLLRYVYLADGTLYNAELVRDGYAFAYTIFPITKLDEFRALEAEARAANRGLWAGCQVNDSDAIKQTAGTK